MHEFNKNETPVNQIGERGMPTIIVEADEGRTVEKKRGLVKDITEAVCKNFNVSRGYD
jgi:hypothetical protein